MREIHSEEEFEKQQKIEFLEPVKQSQDNLAQTNLPVHLERKKQVLPLVFFLKGNIFELCMRGKMILIREMMERMRKEKNKCWAYKLDDKKLNYGPLW